MCEPMMTVRSRTTRSGRVPEAVAPSPAVSTS